MAVFYIFLCVFLLITGSIGTDYIQDYFDQRLDHFNFETYGNSTFKQRYLYNDTYWDRGNGPIFFYLGNEGDIEGLWQGNRFVIETAPQFRALVVFAEHRYYGESLPFGDKSFQPQMIGLLSVQQALADYAFFVKNLKKKLNADNCPVVAFGGSYGGMLTSYFRFKYPNIVVGGIAASAPILQAAGKTSGDLFFRVVSKDFVDAGCLSEVKAAFQQVQKWADAGQSGFQQIFEVFHLCTPISNDKDYDHFLRWARNAFVNAAMMDYPYPAYDLPAFPVQTMCSYLTNANRPADGLYAAVSVYYNNTNPPPKCLEIYEQFIYCADPTGCGLGNDAKAWDYQACTEISLEGGTTGVRDIFPPLPFNSSMRDEYCLKTWNVLPRRDWLDVILWGQDISSATNIVFSNGNLDPWAPGGVLQNISDSLVAVMIDGGAHHIDLRGYNAMDPPSVKFARNFEISNIDKWLREYYENQFHRHQSNKK